MLTGNVRGWILVCALLGAAMSACSASSTTSDQGLGAQDPTILTSDEAPCPNPQDCTTRELADAAGVLLGTAVAADPLESDAQYREVIVETFNSVTPENVLKWSFIHPERDTWNFGPVDTLVAFARKHNLKVKGHALVWHQAEIQSTPDWVLAINDPDELREVLREHITTVMDRFDGAIDRWDVVNEPLETTGTKRFPNHFQDVLGPDYLNEIFTMARQADPDARLFLNEAAVELIPGKADALVELVTQLVADGVPIDGVGLQGHLLAGTLQAGVIRSTVEQIEALGLEAAITELDVPAPGAPNAKSLATQADTYSKALRECFDQSCREVTLWGFTDRYTWIDTLLGAGLAPLPFDEDYQPKPALTAIRDELAALAND